MNNGKATPDYRIYSWDSVIGNASTINLIRRGLREKTLPRALILNGPVGTGKSTAAEIAALNLTCDNPVDGSPCLKCRNCLTNLEALKTTGRSHNLIKVNVAKMNSRADALELVKEIFTLQNFSGYNCYIIEGLDTMQERDQLAFVEEMDRLQMNTSIFICTNTYYNIVEDIRSRCITYRFNRLSKNEASMLFDVLIGELGVTHMSSAMKDLILNYARGVPRELTKQINFIKDLHPTQAELQDYLGVISSSSFTSLIQSMFRGITEMKQELQLLLAQRTSSEIFRQFSDYLLSALFYASGDIKTDLSKEDRDFIRQYLPTSKIIAVCEYIEHVNSFKLNETQLILKMIHISGLITGVSKVEIARKKAATAAVQSEQAQSLRGTVRRVAQETVSAKSSQLNTESLQSLLGTSVGSSPAEVKDLAPNKEDNFIEKTDVFSNKAVLSCEED